MQIFRFFAFFSQTAPPSGDCGTSFWIARHALQDGEPSWTLTPTLLGSGPPNPKITSGDPEIFSTERISTYLLKCKLTWSSNHTKNLNKIALTDFEKIRFEIFGPTPTFRVRPLPAHPGGKIFRGVYRPLRTFLNVVGILPKSISGFELRPMKVLQKFTFWGQLSRNPWCLNLKFSQQTTELFAYIRPGKNLKNRLVGS